MTTVKFDHSVKYNGIRYAAHEVFKVEDEDIAELKKAGATVLFTDTSESPNQPDEGKGEPEQTGDGEHESGDESIQDKDVAKMKEALLGYTVPELTKFAEDNGIDLQGKTRKADIYNIIVAQLQ